MMLGTLIPRSSEDFSDRSLNMLLLDFIMKVVKVLDYSFFTATATFISIKQITNEN